MRRWIEWRKRLGVEPSLPDSRGATDFEDREGHRAPFASSECLGPEGVLGRNRAPRPEEGRGITGAAISSRSGGYLPPEALWPTPTGDYVRAGPLFEESHALLQARGDTANIARSLFNRGAVDLMLDRPETARAYFREGLSLARAMDDKEDIAWCLEGLASLAAAEGAGELASILLGAAGALLKQIGADFKPFERKLHEATRARAESLCGEAGHAAAVEQGAAMALTDALELALGDARR